MNNQEIELQLDQLCTDGLQFDRCDPSLLDHLGALETEAAQAGFAAAARRIVLMRGPSVAEAKQAGDPLVQAEAILSGPRSPLVWRELVELVARWPDDQRHRDAIASLDGTLDLIWFDELREAPTDWWNRRVAGRPVLGWPLVRMLNLLTASEPAAAIDTPRLLKGLTILVTHDVALSVEVLREVATMIPLASLRYESYASSAPETVAAVTQFRGLQALQLTFGRRVDASDLTLEPLSAVGLTNLEVKVTNATRLVPFRGFRGATLTSLELSSSCPIDSLEGLDGLKNLRALTLENLSDNLTNLAALTQLEALTLYSAAHPPLDVQLPSGLRSLFLSNCAVSGSIGRLGELAELKSLTFHETKLTDMDLTVLPGLQHLVLADSPVRRIRLGPAVLSADFCNLSDLVEVDLAPKVELAKLIVEGCPQLGDLQFLAELGKLRHLVLTNLPQAIDLGFINDLRSLQRLELYNCARLTSVPTRSTVPSLEALVVEGCE